jgi:glutamate-1-semialdehyde 2,1-aminomutase
MTTQLSRREDLVRRAGSALGGTLGVMLLPDELSLIVERAEGAYLFDVDGRRYIDYLLGSGPLLLGHARPEIVAAVQEQVSKGLTYYALSEPVIRLAERMIEIIPCAETVKFTSTGSEANFHAMRIARAYTGKDKILKFEGGFHGIHDYSLMSSMAQTPTEYPIPIPDSKGTPASVASDILVSRWNDVGLTEELVRLYRDQLAAVICEPLQRALVPAPGFLRELRRITEENGVLLIFDEVVTGFRLAYGGAQEKYGVVPDLAAFGKALSAGYPMAAIAGRGDIMDVTHPRRAASGDIARFGGTMSGNPAGAVAGLVSLDLLAQDGVYERLYAVTERLRQGLRDLAVDRGISVRVIGEGPVMQLLYTGSDATDYPSFLEADRARTRQFGLECIRRGVTTTPGEKFYISLAHSDDDIEETLRVFGDAFDAVEEVVGR